MTGTTTATVEVLTAEVRTLVVGSRQVTLSVYRQLDVRYGVKRFEPFGRVRDDANKKRPSERPTTVWMVGRDTESDALMAAYINTPDWFSYPPDHVAEEYLHWAIHIPRPAGHPRSVGQVNHTVAEKDGRTLRWSTLEGSGLTGMACPIRASAHVTGPFADKVPPERLCHVDLDALRAEWQPAADEELAMMLAAQADYDRCAALPLIVLAGLR